MFVVVVVVGAERNGIRQGKSRFECRERLTRRALAGQLSSLHARLHPDLPSCAQSRHLLCDAALVKSADAHPHPSDATKPAKSSSIAVHAVTAIHL